MTPKQQLILDAAAKVAIDGAINVSDIAREIGDPGASGINRVNAIIYHLQKKGEWPYTRLSATNVQETVKKAINDDDSEITALKTTYNILKDLQQDARKRILSYLIDKFLEKD